MQAAGQPGGRAGGRQATKRVAAAAACIVTSKALPLLLVTCTEQHCCGAGVVAGACPKHAKVPPRFPRRAKILASVYKLPALKGRLIYEGRLNAACALAKLQAKPCPPRVGSRVRGRVGGLFK